MDTVNIIGHFTTIDYVEWISTLLSLTFLILLVRENKLCWIFGILSSMMMIYVFYEIKLYAEAILYIYYVLIGFYGWYVWNNRDRGELQVSTWSWAKHIPILIGGITASFLLGYFFKTYTDAERSQIDSTTTIFSFIASYMEAHKIFSSWILWIIVNGVSVWLYYDRGLMVYAGLMIIYFAVSIYGLFDWGKKSGVLG